jgi:hypothetical protein
MSKIMIIFAPIIFIINFIKMKTLKNVSLKKGLVSVCLEIRTTVAGKKQVLQKYCCRDAAGIGVYERKTYNCANSDYSSNYCNKITCKNLYLSVIYATQNLE